MVGVSFVSPICPPLPKFAPARATSAPQVHTFYPFSVHTTARMVFQEPTFHKATAALNPSTAFRGPQIKSRLPHTPRTRPCQLLQPLFTPSPPHPNYSHSNPGNPSVLQRNRAFSCLRAFAHDAYLVLHAVTILSSLQVTAEMLLPQGGPHKGEVPSLLLISNSHQAVLFPSFILP